MATIPVSQGTEFRDAADGALQVTAATASVDHVLALFTPVGQRDEYITSDEYRLLSGYNLSKPIARTNNVATAPTATEFPNPADNDAAVVALQNGTIQHWTHDGTNWNLGFSYSTSGTSHNLTATADPTATDDTSIGFTTGSHWYNSTTQTHFIASVVTAGAAVWIPFPKSSTEPAHNLTATTQPGATDDSAAGYVVGLSRWYDTTTQTHYIASDVTAGSAIWLAVSTPTNLGADSLYLIAQRANNTAGVAPTVAEITAANGGVLPTLENGDDARVVLDNGTVELWAREAGVWVLKDTSIPTAPTASETVSGFTVPTATITAWVDESNPTTTELNDYYAIAVPVAADQAFGDTLQTPDFNFTRMDSDGDIPWIKSARTSTSTDVDLLNTIPPQADNAADLAARDAYVVPAGQDDFRLFLEGEGIWHTTIDGGATWNRESDMSFGATFPLNPFVDQSHNDAGSTYVNLEVPGWTLVAEGNLSAAIEVVTKSYAVIASIPIGKHAYFSDPENLFDPSTGLWERVDPATHNGREIRQNTYTGGSSVPTALAGAPVQTLDLRVTRPFEIDINQPTTIAHVNASKGKQAMLTLYNSSANEQPITWTDFSLSEGTPPATIAAGEQILVVLLVARDGVAIL